jgi:hypothetical protein
MSLLLHIAGVTSMDDEVIFWLAFLWILYLVPSIAALTRGSRRQGEVLYVNLLLGWTVLGWWKALMIAVSNKPAPPAPVRPRRERRFAARAFDRQA